LKPETVAKVYARPGPTATKRFGTIRRWSAHLSQQAVALASPHGTLDDYEPCLSNDGVGTASTPHERHVYA
jgi:hypothetical protein